MPDPSSSSLTFHFDAPGVLCIGDVMLDSYVYGDVSRISPEAPIPVLRVEQESFMLGGVGNVVRNLETLGARAHLLCVVGDDSTGERITTMLQELPQTVALTAVEPGRQSSVKTRMVAGGQQLLRCDRETTANISTRSEDFLVAQTQSHLASCKALIVSDYGKGTLTDSLLARVIAAAREAGCPVIVDPKGSDYRRYRGATMVTPNRKELHEATGMPVGNDEQIIAAARHLIDTCGLDCVLATRSQDGMSLVHSNGEVHHLAAEAREVFDVSGAGDTVVATMATALASGIPLVNAARLANAAAGVVVGKKGTATLTTAELSFALRHQAVHSAELKVLTREDAAPLTALWQSQGLKVGFTNGCFDLLHPGHLSLLRQSRAACDRLVIGLNSDASVQRLKGPTRPVQNEMARASVLASLAMVDLVVIFGEDTPLECIKALRPDVLVKGADYTIETVVGADLVQGWGGKVLLASLEAGQSTTNTIRRINAS